MRLFAFCREDEDKDLSKHHALDLRTVVAMQVECHRRGGLDTLDRNGQSRQVWPNAMSGYI